MVPHHRKKTFIEKATTATGQINTDFVIDQALREALKPIKEAKERRIIRKKVESIIFDERVKKFPLFTIIDIIFVAVAISQPEVSIPVYLAKKLLIELGVRVFLQIGTKLPQIQAEVKKFRRGRHTAKDVEQLTLWIMRNIFNMKTILPFQLVSMTQFVNALIRADARNEKK